MRVFNRRFAQRAVASVSALALFACAQIVHAQEVMDEYYWLSQMNKAANVMLLEQGVFDAEAARNNAATIMALDEQMEGSDARTGDYKIIEPMLIEIGGYDVSSLHSGRSRVDIVATSRRLMQRGELLKAMEALNATRLSILDFAEKNKRDLLPAYTQGKQSAAVPLGHYLGAYAASLSDEAKNLQDAYEVVNQSPLGAGAVITSSFPVDRQVLSDMLGFAHPLENSIYANETSIIGTGAKIVGATTSGALIVGTLVSDLELQYARTKPWFTVIEAEGTLTSRSSSMPHKVNPTILNNVRQQASLVIGMGTTYVIRSHNVQHGMPDSKRSEPDQAMALYVTMLKQTKTLFDNLEFHPDRARAEVEIEYAAAPELSDMMQREYGVPFRVGHDYSSLIVDYGKENDIDPADFPYDVAQQIFRDVAVEYELDSEELPLSAEEFAQALSADNMVDVVKGMGGAQPAEVDRMLADERAKIDADTQWIQQQRDHLAAAAATLEEAFQKTAQ